MKIFTMTKTVARNLARGPVTRPYPQQARQLPPLTRGRIVNDIDRCIFCGLCARRCPTYAITVEKEQREWRIDRLKCCICGLCVEVCPVKCLATESRHAATVIGKDESLCALRAAAAEPAAGDMGPDGGKS